MLILFFFHDKTTEETKLFFFFFFFRKLFIEITRNCEHEQILSRCSSPLSTRWSTSKDRSGTLNRSLWQHLKHRETRTTSYTCTQQWKSPEPQHNDYYMICLVGIPGQARTAASSVQRHQDTSQLRCKGSCLGGMFILQWEQNINMLPMSLSCIHKIIGKYVAVLGPTSNSLQWSFPVGQWGRGCSSRGLHCLNWHACGKGFDTEKMALNLKMAFQFFAK